MLPKQLLIGGVYVHFKIEENQNMEEKGSYCLDFLVFLFISSGGERWVTLDKIEAAKMCCAGYVGNFHMLLLSSFQNSEIWRWCSRHGNFCNKM